MDVAEVLRGASPITLPARELVVGDIITIRAGWHVPADARLISVRALRVQEAVLTGEAADTGKSVGHVPGRTTISGRHNMVYAGTTVVAGSAVAVVTAIGTQTEFGKIANVIRTQPSPDSPLRRNLQTAGIAIGLSALLVVVALALLQLASGVSLQETFRLAITLVVSAIPEDLTMILTIALTVGVMRMARQGGVVKQLSAAEALGEATIIAIDKTGTITQGEMKAKEFHFLQGETLEPGSIKKGDLMQEMLLTGMLLANEATVNVAAHDGTGARYAGSATERCALEFAECFGYSQKSIKKQWSISHGIHFSSAWKYRAVLAAHPTQHSQTLFVLGAPEVLLAASVMCLDEGREIVHISAARRAEIVKKLDALAAAGKRLLGVAIKRHLSPVHIGHKDVHGLSFLGVLAIEDPIRPEVPAALQETTAAGVKVKIISGDHVATAQAVARSIGLPADISHVITSEEMAAKTDDELSQHIERFTVFARIEPLDKQRIVRLLQAKKHIVAMTGDGINDAVALRGADIGVAMGSGSDVAKDASDMILLNNSFATIVAAIKEGRVLRDNVRKVMAYLLATNTAEVLIFFGSILLGLPLPLTAAQILWINLVTSGTSDIALSFEGPEDDVMRRGPEKPGTLLLGKRLSGTIGYAGLLMTLSSLFVFWLTLEAMHQPLEVARTVTFTFLAVTSLLSVWSFRSSTQGMFAALSRNYWLFVSAGFSFCLQMAAMYVPFLRSFFGTVPLGFPAWVAIVLGSLVVVVLMDMRKIFWPALKDSLRAA